MPTNLVCRPLERCWENGACSYIPEALAFGGKAIFCNLNDVQELSVQRQKNSAKRACNTLLVTMKQI